MVFANLGAFSRFMGVLAVREHLLDKAGRGKVAELFKREIKDLIGTVGKLPPPLAQSTIDQKGHDRPLFKTGALKESIRWEHASPRKTIVGTDDKKAIYHELGGSTPGRPPRRSFFASTAQEHNDKAFGLYVSILTRISTGVTHRTE